VAFVYFVVNVSFETVHTGGCEMIRSRARGQRFCRLAVAVIALLPAVNLAAQRGQQAPPGPRRLAIVERGGNRTDLGQVPGISNGPRVSPDGRRLAIGIDGLYVGPLTDPTALRRIGPGRFPYWSHDGARLFFEAPDAEILLWRRVDADDAGEQLGTPVRAPESRSPDGRLLSFVQSVDNKFSGWTIDLTARTRTQIPDSGPEALGTNISPDGRWIAYQSTASGRYEIYVQPLGRPGPAVQVTTDGAFRPLWAPNSRELFFDDGKQQLFAVPIRTEPAFAVTGPPVALPITGFVQGGVGRRMYDLLPDGRFLMMFPE
jgi:eukaryotic-like serine/threonine-protein kinase